jgi:DNA repair protein RecN (Recombination protein N)
MLLELTISNFAIIEQTTIQFSDGLNVLTGETGAGKSILLDALGAVLGARVSSDLVRTGTRVARVEAAFALADTDRTRVAPLLDELGVELDDDTLIVAREIHASGRSTARINGRMSTAGVLAQVGSLLVDIHGQSDHLAILRSAEQRNLLDRFAGVEDLIAEMSSAVRSWHEARRNLDDLSRNSREREQRIDLLRFQVNEITEAALREEEELALASDRDVLRNADRLRSDALEALANLVADDLSESPSATVLLRKAVSLVEDIASLDGGAASIAERANEVLVLAEDLARELRDYGDRVESDEARLEVVEDRIALLQDLKRKYGATLSEVIEYGESAQQELEQLTSGAYDLDVLIEREKTSGERAGRIAGKLSARRQEEAVKLARAIEASISELNMGRSSLKIDVRQREDERGVPVEGQRLRVDETGIDEVEFLIAPNAGEALKPLSRIASGGETARLMLATKSILSAVDLTPTLVFDEIDVGVGGRSGQVVGEKLWGISREHQVIVITHLPQIAAFAESHLRIEKHLDDERTVSEVRQLNDAERQLEIAAMIDGLPPGEAARLNAQTMLERSREFISTAR